MMRKYIIITAALALLCFACAPSDPSGPSDDDLAGGTSRTGNAKVAGTVSTSQSGVTQLEDTRVIMYQTGTDGDSLIEMPVDTAYTDSAGNFVFDTPDTGSFALFARFTGTADTLAAFTGSFTVTDTVETLIAPDLDLRPLHGILVWIKPERAGCGGSLISLTGGLRSDGERVDIDREYGALLASGVDTFITATDSVGRTFIAGLAPGTYTVGFSLSCPDSMMPAFVLPLEITTDIRHEKYSYDYRGVTADVMMWNEGTDEDNRSRLILIDHPDFTAFMWVGTRTSTGP